jgi:hypothetical protein
MEPEETVLFTVSAEIAQAAITQVKEPLQTCLQDFLDIGRRNDLKKTSRYDPDGFKS